MQCCQAQFVIAKGMTMGEGGPWEVQNAAEFPLPFFLEIFTSDILRVCQSPCACVAAPLQWHRATLCTIRLRCAPPNCNVHHGTQGKPLVGVNRCVGAKGPVIIYDRGGEENDIFRENFSRPTQHADKIFRGSLDTV